MVISELSLLVNWWSDLQFQWNQWKLFPIRSHKDKHWINCIVQLPLVTQVVSDLAICSLNFISKILEICLWGSSSSSGARLRLFNFSTFEIYHISKQTKLQRFHKVNISSFKNPKTKHRTWKFGNGTTNKKKQKNNRQVRYTDLSTFSEFQILRYENDIFKDVPIISVIYFWSILVISTGSGGRYLVTFLVFPEMIQKYWNMSGSQNRPFWNNLNPREPL